MKRITILALAIVFLIGCSNPTDFITEKKVLPEGYKVLCSVDGGKYTLQIPMRGYFKGSSFTSPLVHNSENEAIRSAINYEKHRNIVYKDASEEYEWEVCPKKEG